MNAIMKTKGETFKAQLVRMRPNIAAALPSHISPEKFERVALTAVQQNPDLLNADQHSLFLSCQRAAADGLLPDGRDAALVVYKTKGQDGQYRKAVQYLPMVAGITKLARNSGEIASISAHIVYKGEKFAVVLGDEEHIEHERDMEAVDNAEPVAAYAVAKLKNGETVREVMTWKQIMKRKAVSRAQNGPWNTWTEEMAKKTLIKALAKRLPFDTDKEPEARARQAIERTDDDFIDSTAETVEPDAQEQTRPSNLDAIEGQIADEPEDEAPHIAIAKAIQAARSIEDLDAVKKTQRAVLAMIAKERPDDAKRLDADFDQRRRDLEGGLNLDEPA